MGLFSFLSRKNGTSEGASTLARTGESTRLAPANTEADRARQREISRVTAAKIDAIELEMSSDIFNQPEPAWGHPPARSVIQSTGATLRKRNAGIVRKWVNADKNPLLRSCGL